MAGLYSQQLDFRGGASEVEQRSLQIVNEYARRDCNKPENSSAKSVSLTDRALRFLARRDHGRQELINKLKRYQPDILELENTLQYLDTQQLLDDKSFCHKYIRYRAEQGIGPLKISQELKIKGIERQMIACALSENDHLWPQALTIAHRKKFKLKMPANFPEKMQQKRFFLSRGFLSELIESYFLEKNGSSFKI